MVITTDIANVQASHPLFPRVFQTPATTPPPEIILKKKLRISNRKKIQLARFTLKPTMSPHEIPKIDTSTAAHTQITDLTHDRTQGRSMSEENRRSSAGEIVLSDTDVAWLTSSPDGKTRNDTRPSPPSDSSGSLAEYLGRKRRNSLFGSVGAVNANSPGGLGTMHPTLKLDATNSVQRRMMSGCDDELKKMESENSSMMDE
ncbi:hypothetical protein H072_520 [Dactylellina haptotyla CBS 200.50]|uniref:Uncharacterized protein n=1 Tax=Dactylellina haptotyla (strain CBS 200.50) TaxID=1284197 RepID=S8ARJ8_DACHA|nr:hypothetical protein H072_520 [Dactylellina haptotyla CBS 200.50]